MTFNPSKIAAHCFVAGSIYRQLWLAVNADTFRRLQAVQNECVTIHHHSYATAPGNVEPQQCEELVVTCEELSEERLLFRLAQRFTEKHVPGYQGCPLALGHGVLTLRLTRHD